MQILLRNEFCLVFFLSYYSIAINKQSRARQVEVDILLEAFK